MKKIKSFSLVSFTNHALVSFCAEVESHVKASLPVENAALCDDFSASLNAFKDILASNLIYITMTDRKQKISSLHLQMKI